MKSRGPRRNSGTKGANGRTSDPGEPVCLGSVAEREGFELAVRIHWGRLMRKEVSVSARCLEIEVSRVEGTSFFELMVELGKTKPTRGFCLDKVIATGSEASSRSKASNLCSRARTSRRPSCCRHIRIGLNMLTSHRPWSLAKALQIPGGCGRAATAKDRRCGIRS